MGILPEELQGKLHPRTQAEIIQYPGDDIQSVQIIRRQQVTAAGHLNIQQVSGGATSNSVIPDGVWELQLIAINFASSGVVGDAEIIMRILDLNSTQIFRAVFRNPLANTEHRHIIIPLNFIVEEGYTLQQSGLNAATVFVNWNLQRVG